MNRFAFFISLILLVNLSSNFEFDKKVYGTIYDKAILLIKGMSDSKEPQCYNTFRDKKDILLDFFLELIPYIQTHSEEISLSYIFSLFSSLVRKGLPMTFLDDCKIVPLYGIYEDFIDYNTRVERIQTFGNNIQTKATILSGVVYVNRYICCNCGYSEEWIDKNDIRTIIGSKKIMK